MAIWPSVLTVVLGCVYDPTTSNEPELALLALARADFPFSVVSESVGGSPGAMVIDGSSIFIAGSSNPGGNLNWRVERRDRYTGELVSEFGTAGVLDFDPGSGNDDDLTDIALDATYIYLVGNDRSSGSPQWRIEKRLASTGALVSGFGSGGVITNDPTPGQNDFLNAIAIDGTYMYLAGSQSTGGSAQDWRLEKRDLASGSLDGGFGTGGVIVQGAGSGTQSQAWAVTYDTSYLYYGGAYRAATVDWRTEKRDRTTGALVGGFGTGGQVAGPANAGRDEIYDIEINSDSVFVSGLTLSPTVHYRFDRYLQSDGSNAGAFGTGGTIDNDFSSGTDTFGDIIVDSPYVFLLGSDFTNGSDRLLRVEKFDEVTGAYISAFGSGGVLQINNFAGEENLRAGRVDGTFLYMVGEDQSTSPAAWRLLKYYKSTGTQ